MTSHTPAKNEKFRHAIESSVRASQKADQLEHELTELRNTLNTATEAGPQMRRAAIQISALKEIQLAMAHTVAYGRRLEAHSLEGTETELDRELYSKAMDNFMLLTTLYGVEGKI